MVILSIVCAAIGGALYRLRGGWFADLMLRLSRSLTGRPARVAAWLGNQRTQIMRLIWSIPTAGLFALALGLSWLVALELAVSTFLGLALIGHGAHMVHDAKEFIDNSKNKTELLTKWWLPAVFGGIPDATTPHWKVSAYNIAGMSWIGLVRNLITVAPLFFAGHEVAALIYTAAGALHGPLYWIGWRINGASATSEVVVGAASWALIVNL